MIPSFFPRSQASPIPTAFAEIGPTRFCSVGENGIKLYSNMRPNASFRCDQSANWSCATWIATSNPELLSSCLDIAQVLNRRLRQFIHPYRCLQRIRRFLADSDIRQKPDRRNESKL
jgi:hypothetical protein